MPDDTRQVHYFNIHEEHLAYAKDGTVLPRPVPTEADVNAITNRIADAILAKQDISHHLGELHKLRGGHMLGEAELKRDAATHARIKAALGDVPAGCYVNFDGTEEWKSLKQYRDDLNSP